MEYGTGAIMAVPAHDERDFEFAERVRPRDPAGRRAPADGDGSPRRGRVRRALRGRGARQLGRVHGPARARGQARDRRVARAERGRGEATIGYRLRDWLLSRQRYWGCPIPIVHCDACGIVPVPDDELPVLLPEIDDYLPKGRSPLAAAEDWVRDDVPDAAAARRGARPTRWTRSSTRPGTSSATATRRTTRRRSIAQIVDYWLPVNQYIGGVEHAILHLIYARFFVEGAERPRAASASASRSRASSPRG